MIIKTSLVRNLLFALMLGLVTSVCSAAYSDADKVYRGGLCTAALFSAANGATADASGKLYGVSVNIAPGKSPEVATASIRNKKVGVATVGAILKAGGKVVPSPNAANPYHATLSGLTPAVAESLFQPSLIPNPSQQCPK